jgi:excisionase family DNA binding protein
MIEELPRWYTEEQVAEHYGVSVFTVRRWRRRGELKAKKLGAKWKIREDWLITFEEQTCASERESLGGSGSPCGPGGRTGTLPGSTGDKLGTRQRALKIGQKPKDSSPNTSH